MCVAQSSCGLCSRGSEGALQPSCVGDWRVPELSGQGFSGELRTPSSGFVTWSGKSLVPSSQEKQYFIRKLPRKKREQGLVRDLP